MTELNPKDVLADLFDSEEFEPAMTRGHEVGAELVMNRLRDAGFAVVDAKRFAALEAALEAVGKGTE